ncbi:MAG: hypothetical protein COU33_03980 [Candidatus Magasanikbacteria bacterium CG10_big_fil_rev_8_21_14_0_10_43_6]|uniref:Uncharacterized protein n=1 Tax=Candidatus Magasanikbacteria bacterium CG10_big_fil_rev_8_21_14_0_10_43_6 TaxID=1974650 RepID=A0A2M6W0I2_9BACT|nr:MAG: hypothetical protein COU33_03980 [Candidatus Magasanikbacteria bacterium CG10_big_fil_rev_8_21_14_0_10_43_6]
MGENGSPKPGQTERINPHREVRVTDPHNPPDGLGLEDDFWNDVDGDENPAFDEFVSGDLAPQDDSFGPEPAPGKSK